MMPVRFHIGFFVLIACLCLQCHNHPTDSTQQASQEAAKTEEAVLVTNSSEEVAKKTKEVATEAMEEGKAKLIAIKDKATEKATTVKTEIKKEAAVLEKKAKETIEKKTVAKPKPKPKPKKRSKIKFEETVHDYGMIKQGDVVKHDFKFTNTGNAPLVIKKVDVSCGCTFPSYPFIPIEPGKEGTIGVTFNSTGKVGPQKPTITVVTNGRPRTLKLNLKGFVE